MVLLVLYFVILLITLSNSQDFYFKEEYVRLTMWDDPTYNQYAGYYFKNSTTRTYCNSTPSPLIYGGTLFYKLERVDAWLYADGQLVKTDGNTDGADVNNGDLNSRVVLTTSDPHVDCTSFNYVLYSIMHFDEQVNWGDLDFKPQSARWCDGDFPDTNCNFNITVCTSLGTHKQCNTIAPSESPTANPTTSTKTPTVNPTPAPTAPRVKYKLHQILTTSSDGCGNGCDPFDLSITLFIWSDPLGPSYARITLTGPNDRPFMVLFTQYEYSLQGEQYWEKPGYEFMQQLSGNNVTGFLVDPIAKEAGEVVINRGNGTDYSDFLIAYKQNSTIEEFDTNYKADTTLITFSRTLTTTDHQDWQFKFTELLDDFYICFPIFENGYSDTKDKGCVIINGNIEGNYGIRTTFESDPTLPSSPPQFTIHFEWDPFLFKYSGYVIKPKNTWLLWGLYDESNQTTARATNTWQYVTICDVDGTTQFGDLENVETAQRYVAGYGIAGLQLNTGIDDLGSNERINFTAIRTGELELLDMDARARGWNTAKFLTTREIIFNIWYGDSGNQMNDDHQAGVDKYYGSVLTYLDYVTYAPSVAPTQPPTPPPTNNPSRSPTKNPATANKANVYKLGVIIYCVFVVVILFSL